MRRDIARKGPISLVDKALALLKVIRKIPMFNGLNSEQTRSVLQACEFRGVRGGEEICRVNGQSDEMYILLSGRMGVYNESQILLASIDPVDPVGEMGLITGQLRSATVSASSDCNLLVLRKVAFDRLMRNNMDLCTRVYSSVIEMLGRRLDESRGERGRMERNRVELEVKLNEVENQIDKLTRGRRQYR